MVSQLRIYTINRGMMDSWINLFEEKLRPGHEKHGISIESTWVNMDKTEFIWVRSFESLDDIPVKEREYYSSPERLAIGEEPQKHIAKIEVRTMNKSVISSTD